jgi:predicted amidohydrolase
MRASLIQLSVDSSGSAEERRRRAASLVRERRGDFDRSGDLRGRYRKIHRYGFDTGEATLMGGGDDIVTVPTDFGVIGLPSVTTCDSRTVPGPARRGRGADRGARRVARGSSHPLAAPHAHEGAGGAGLPPGLLRDR